METVLPSPGEDAADAPRRRRMLSAFAHHDFRYLLAGTMGSQMGDWIQTVGQGWLVYQLTGSAAQLGVFSFIRGLSVLVITPFGGAIADRMNRRTLLSSSAFLAALSAVMLAVLVATGLIRLWQLYVTAVLDGLVVSVSQPTRQVMVYDVVGTDDLTNAIALNAMGVNLTRIVGPSLGGLLIGTLGVSSCFFGQAIAFVIASASTFLIRNERARVTTTAPVLSSIAEGVRYTVHHRTVLTLLAIATIPSLLVYPYLRFMPVFATSVYHVGGLGLGVLLTAIGFGSIAGAAWVANLGAFEHKGWAMMIGNVVYMAFIGFFAIAHNVIAAFACLVVAGLANTVYNTFNQTLLQFNIEDEYRGRVLALYLMFSAITPVGALLMGPMMDAWGAPWVLFSWCALATLLQLALMARSSRMRAL
jgi:predicted MFS family arabinose efflux permease